MDAEEVKAAIDRLFSDTTVLVSVTRERLDDLKAHIDMLLESLPDPDE